MNLPYSPNTAYAPNQPIKSVDLNAIQACIVGRKHGVIERWTNARAPSSLLVNATAFAYKIAANADACLIDGIDVGSTLTGDLISGGKVRIFGTAAAQDIQVNIQLNKTDGTQALLLSATIHNPAAVWAIVDLGLAVPYQPGGHVMLAGETLEGFVSIPKNTGAYGAMGLIFSHP